MFFILGKHAVSPSLSSYIKVIPSSVTYGDTFPPEGKALLIPIIRFIIPHSKICGFIDNHG